MTRRNPLWRLLALLFAVSLVAAACGDDDEPEEDASASEADAGGEDSGGAGGDGTLKIGYLLPQTGDLSFLGPPMIKGVEMAIADINAAGGVNGKDVELVEADDGTDPDVASTAVDRLLSEDVDAIIGAAATGVTLAVIDKITGAGVVECSPSNTGSNLTDYEDDGYYFRTAPPDNLQGQALGDLITDDGNTNVGIIALNNDYGKGFAEHLTARLEDNGATVAAEVFYDPNGTDFAAEAKQVADAGVDAVAVIAYPETGGQVFSAMIANGIGPADVPVYVTDGLQSNSLYETIDANNAAVTQGVRGTAASSAPENGASFFPEAFAEFAPDVDTIYSAHAYDCAVLIALAAIAGESDDPTSIRDEINGITADGEKCSTVQECVDLLEGGDDIDYDGAAGPLDFTDAGEPGAGTYDIYEFQADGTYATETQVVIEPEE
jgi:ABC-type branched-subunit amino acid transport system substrate-binding protein